MSEPTTPPTPTEAEQTALIASFVQQAQAAGLKVRWHNEDIVVIGRVRPQTEANDSSADTASKR